MIKLVLCDMDLTLVPRPHQTVTPLGLAAIHDLLDQGVYVGAASGRGIPDLRVQFAGDEACVRTAVASNGCEVMADGELICHNPLPREELEAALEVVRPLPGCFFTADMNGVRGIVGGTRDEVLRRFRASKNITFAFLDTFPAGDLVKVNITFEVGVADAHEVVARLQPLCPSIDFCILDKHVADLMPRGWSKARGAQALLDHFGLTPDELLVFGDSENDLPLAQAFPQSAVAMANAIVPLREVARWHIGPCFEDSCAKALQELADAQREGRTPTWMSDEANAAALHRALTDESVSAEAAHNLWKLK